MARVFNIFISLILLTQVVACASKSKVTNSKSPAGQYDEFDSYAEAKHEKLLRRYGR